jgi:NAD(P)H-dependent FMN reductase
VTTEPLRIGILLASVREGRRGEAFARWVHDLAAARPDLRPELLDLRAWALPPYARKEVAAVAEKAYAPDTLEGRWRDLVAALDGYVVVTPEYNHSFPGQLKNALDHLYGAWSHKPVTFVSYGGFAAGARAAEQLRLVAVELRMVPVRDEVNLRLVGLAADEQGRPTDPVYARRAAAALDDLAWWATVLREGRRNHPR